MRVSQGWVGPLFVAPAGVLLLLSVVLPFFLAVASTFTDQRLLSPNPTHFVGLENYRRVLSLALVRVPSAEDGESPASLRDVLRQDPKLRYHRRLLGFGSLHPTRDAPARRERSRVDDRPSDQGSASGVWVLVATDPVFYRSLFNTLLFAALVIPLQCGAALALALLIHQPAPGRTVFRTLLFSPVVASMVVVSVVWTFLYQPREGFMTALAVGLSGGFVTEVPWLESAYLALPSIVFMSAWQGAGFQMLIFLAGLQSIDPTLYEAAMLDGANRWQRFRHVTWPGLRNTTIFVVISTTIAAFGLFTQVDVMTAGGPNDATSTLIYHAVQTGFREQDVAYGATVAVIFFVLVFAVALLQRALTRGQRMS